MAGNGSPTLFKSNDGGVAVSPGGLSPSQAVVTDANSALASLAYLATGGVSNIVSRDASGNSAANNFLRGYRTTATAASTTTLTVADTYDQYFTGVTTQTVKLPVTNTLVTGFKFLITNLSTGVVTVQSSGANNIVAMAANTQLLVTCISTSGTGTSSWSWTYLPGISQTTLNGILNQILPSQGGNSTKFLQTDGSNATWQAATATVALNYAQAYFDSTYAWNATSTGSFTDLTNTAVGTFTVRNSSGITVTAAGSNLPGITFTPNAASAVYFIMTTFSPRSTPGQDMGYQLTDGTNIFCDTPYFINNDSGTSIYLPVNMGGIYVPGAASAKTIKITAKSNSSPIGPVSGYGQAMEWTVIQIK